MERNRNVQPIHGGKAGDKHCLRSGPDDFCSRQKICQQREVCVCVCLQMEILELKSTITEFSSIFELAENNLNLKEDQ